MTGTPIFCASASTPAGHSSKRGPDWAIMISRQKRSSALAGIVVVSGGQWGGTPSAREAA
jgi:hypothetical protein